MQKEEKPALFLFLLMQRYAFCPVFPKDTLLCHGLSRDLDKIAYTRGEISKSNALRSYKIRGAVCADNSYFLLLQ